MSTDAQFRSLTFKDFDATVLMPNSDIESSKILMRLLMPNSDIELSKILMALLMPNSDLGSSKK